MRKVSRRDFVLGGGLVAVGFTVGLTTSSLISSPSYISGSQPATPEEALQKLLEGNKRFMSGSVLHPDQSAERRRELVSGQSPWGVVLGCVDSRVPPEIVFDLGLGDIFTARTAAQVIDNAVLGSLEFAVEEGAKVLMVLGHQACAGVKATISAMQSGAHVDAAIDYLVEAIKPAVQSVLSEPGDLLDNSVRANVSFQIAKLSSTSSILSHAVEAGDLKIVGAYYDLGTGQVAVIA